ncbi:hypothetical protein GCM10022407_14550 [Hymenobacter antarcticus]|uniref:Uncharacterized protein n=2 Tax=Hymenobacter antarcticus TaxID=486270 RepID=A0ABP7PQU8_9BACT
MAEAAAQTLRLFQHQLATAKSLLPSQTSAQDMPTQPSNAPASGRDFREWLLDGAYYPKGRFPLVVFKKYVEQQYTLAELTALFAADKVYSKAVRGNKIVFKPAAEVTGKADASFHGDLVRTKDGKFIRVTNQIGMNNFPELLQYLADLFHFPIQTKS